MTVNYKIKPIRKLSNIYNKNHQIGHHVFHSYTIQVVAIHQFYIVYIIFNMSYAEEERIVNPIPTQANSQYEQLKK